MHANRCQTPTLHETIQILQWRVLAVLSTVNSAMQNRLQNSPGVKSELFQELEDQCYPVLKLEDEIQTFAIVGGPKVDLTLRYIN
jgi:hypothetical protein